MLSIKSILVAFAIFSATTTALPKSLLERQAENVPVGKGGLWTEVQGSPVRARQAENTPVGSGGIWTEVQGSPVRARQAENTPVGSGGIWTELGSRGVPVLPRQAENTPVGTGGIWTEGAPALPRQAESVPVGTGGIWTEVGSKRSPTEPESAVPTLPLNSHACARKARRQTTGGGETEPCGAT